MCGAFGEGSEDELAAKTTSAPAIDATAATAEQRLKTQQQKQEAARHIVCVAVAMQDVIRARAEETGLDIALRIGIHTGRVIGGIIGTVRFHFDMWGPGLIGAGHMETLCKHGKVHISDATAAQLGGVFPLSSKRQYSDDTDQRKTLFSVGIRHSFTIDQDALLAEGENGTQGSEL